MELVFEQAVGAPLEAVWAFHADPANLEVLMRGWPGFRMLRHGGSILPGAETWVETGVAPLLRITMGFRHGIHDPPRRFGEEMIHGPFARFRHLHEFEPRDGGTSVRDSLDIRLPVSLGGEAACRLFAAPSVRRAFAFRHAALRRIDAAGAFRARGA